jgi:hypothetical protein
LSLHSTRLHPLTTLTKDRILNPAWPINLCASPRRGDLFSIIYDKTAHQGRHVPTLGAPPSNAHCRFPVEDSQEAGTRISLSFWI